MERYRLNEIALMKNLSVERARNWVREEISHGNWAMTRSGGAIYYVQLVPDVAWHDIFNLRSRKAQGQAWSEYRRIIDEKVYS